MRGAEVGPFTEIRLAEQGGASAAKTLNDEGILRRDEIGEGERARRRLHAIGGVEVVLHKDRDPVQRAARSFLLALAIQRVGYLEGVRIRFDDGAELWPLFVDLVDA